MQRVLPVNFSGQMLLRVLTGQCLCLTPVRDHYVVLAAVSGVS